MTPPSPPTTLPYTDTKPHGAGDFYFAINATFRFLLKEKGYEGWVRYLRAMAGSYFAPVNTAWKAAGLPAVARYWRDFFAAEPGAVVHVDETLSGEVALHIQRCPAIAHLRAHQREIVPLYCQHCFILGQARAEAAGLGFRLEGGNGACRHRYLADDASRPPQDITAIHEAGPC